MVFKGATLRDPDFETGEPLRNSFTPQPTGWVMSHFRVDAIPGRTEAGDAVNDLTVVLLRHSTAFSIISLVGGIKILLVVF